MIPQIIILVLAVMSVSVTLAKNGEYKKGKYNVVPTLIGVIMELSLLYWGGFFDCFFK